MRMSKQLINHLEHSYTTIWSSRMQILSELGATSRADDDVLGNGSGIVDSLKVATLAVLKVQ